VKELFASLVEDQVIVGAKDGGWFSGFRGSCFVWDSWFGYDVEFV
jgi:hypothetical protein